MRYKVLVYRDIPDPALKTIFWMPGSYNHLWASNFHVHLIKTAAHIASNFEFYLAATYNFR
jgi:hypothetical protein